MRFRSFCFLGFASVVFLPWQAFATTAEAVATTTTPVAGSVVATTTMAISTSTLDIASSTSIIPTPTPSASSKTYPRRAGEFASALVMDQETGKIVYAYHPEKVWPAASITKLLAAMVFLEYRPAWTSLIAIKKSDEVGGARLRLAVGSKITVKDAYYSSLLGSANNATIMMARSTGYSVSGFVKKMNAMAKRIGMKQSRFVDPSGIRETNTSTAFDIAMLAKAAYARPDIRVASQKTTYAFRVRKPVMDKVIANTNKLLDQVEGFEVIGGKTGYLEESQYNFVMNAREADSRRRYIVVVLGSPTKQGAFESAEALVQRAARSRAE